MGVMPVKPYTLSLSTGPDISLHDITAEIRSFLAATGIRNGFIVVTSQHTTTAVAINEYEARLVEDTKTLLKRLSPPQDKYLHNDIHLRDCPPDEPTNAHSHLAAMLLGSSEVVPVHEGELVLGRYQSVLLYELDGPRQRHVSLRILGD